MFTNEQLNATIDSGIIDEMLKDTSDIEYALLTAAKQSPELLGIAFSLFGNKNMIGALATVFITKYMDVRGLSMVKEAFKDSSV